MMLVDSHCHLDFPEFDDDRAELIRRCGELGIQRFIVPGVRASSWQHLYEVSQCHLEIIPAYGLHPCFVGQHTPEDIVRLEKLITAYHPVAIGEIGLDYYQKQEKQQQIEFFSEQLRLAEKYHLPVILHVRKAHDDVLRLLKQKKLVGGIVHAFNGSEQQAAQYNELGFLLGFGGTLLNKNARKITNLAKKLPLQWMVLETDSPDMAPAEQANRRNTPLTIYPVANALAFLRRVTLAHIAEVTTENLFFKIPFHL